MKLAAALAVIALAAHAHAVQPTALAPPQAAITQRIGAELPLQLPLLDENGRSVRLADYFTAHRPVLLVLGYYQCSQLCGLLMNGLLEGLQRSGVSNEDWRIVGVSIDPADTPATARSRRALDLAYAEFQRGPASSAPPDLHLLTAPSGQERQLAGAIGFDYQPQSDADRTTSQPQFAHPAAVIVATPAGKVSSYLMGVSFDPAELRVALADAAGNRLGRLSSRLALLCAHFDPRTGRHSAAVMNAVRIAAITTFALLAAWCWRQRGRKGSRP